jgi:hypothetical protein
MKLSAQHGADVNNEGAQLLRQFIRQLADTYKDSKKLHADKVAAMGAIELHYVDYTQLSLDPLHCSMTALGRHVRSERYRKRKRWWILASSRDFMRTKLRRPYVSSVERRWR